MLKPADFIKAGYRKYPIGSFDRSTTLADFSLQKRIDDDKGKKYFITIYVYDYVKSNHAGKMQKDWGFAPKSQFCRGKHPTIDTELIVDTNTSIEEIEATFEALFTASGAEYYELWD